MSQSDVDQLNKIVNSITNVVDSKAVTLANLALADLALKTEDKDVLKFLLNYDSKIDDGYSNSLVQFNAFQNKALPKEILLDYLENDTKLYLWVLVAEHPDTPSIMIDRIVDKLEKNYLIDSKISETVVSYLSRRPNLTEIQKERLTAWIIKSTTLWASVMKHPNSNTSILIKLNSCFKSFENLLKDESLDSTTIHTIVVYIEKYFPNNYENIKTLCDALLHHKNITAYSKILVESYLKNHT